MLNLILGLIPSLFTTVNGITTAISNEKLASITATTQEAKIAADERVSALQAQRDVLISSQANSKLDIYGRSLIGYSVGFLLAKILVWDKALGQWTGGHTDSVALGDNWMWVVTAAVGFYLVTSTKLFNK